MGKPKTQRTQDKLKQIAQYILAGEVKNRIEQHNFDKLIERGLVVVEPTGNPEIYDYDPEYKFKRGGASGKA